MRSCTSSQLTTRTAFSDFIRSLTSTGSAERAGAGGRTRPPVLLDADVIEGEAGVGDKDQRQQSEQRPRNPVREPRLAR